MSKRFGLLVSVLLVFAAAPAPAKPLKVVTSTTDLAWAAAKIGGKHVEAHPLLTGIENPHYVNTIPDFIRQVADADVVCVVGFQLEIGWMPKVLERSGNAKVQVGGNGYCETGMGVTPLQKPRGPVNRSMGDVHPAGNPHYWLSPDHFAEGAAEIRNALVRVDPAHGEDYLKNHEALVRELQALKSRIQARLTPVLSQTSGPVLIEYHSEFTYFLDAYGIRSFGSIEEKPGVPPSAGRLAQVSLGAKAAGVKLAIGGTYAPAGIMERFAELSGIPTKLVPTSIQKAGKVTDYGALQDELARVVLDALAGEPAAAKGH